MMPRPKRRDDNIVLQAARNIAEDVMEWDQDIREDETDRIVQDLVEAMRYGDTDGYKIAKELDHNGWDPDSELVEILDYAWSYVNKAHKEAVREWVKANSIKPSKKLGDAVEYKSLRDGLVTGVISKIYPEVAEYVLSCESLGHKIDGKLGPTGFIIPFEEIETPEERAMMSPLFEGQKAEEKNDEEMETPS